MCPVYCVTHVPGCTADRAHPRVPLPHPVPVAVIQAVLAALPVPRPAQRVRLRPHQQLHDPVQQRPHHLRLRFLDTLAQRPQNVHARTDHRVSPPEKGSCQCTLEDDTVVLCPRSTRPPAGGLRPSLRSASLPLTPRPGTLLSHSGKLSFHTRSPLRCHSREPHEDRPTTLEQLPPQPVRHQPHKPPYQKMD